MKIFLALLLALLALNLSAQTIKSVKYVGMVHLSKAVAIRMLDFEVGDDVNEVLIDKAVKKYFKQGYFNDVWADLDNGVLTFNFKEKPIISKIEIKGWKESDKEVTGSVIQIKKGSLYDERKLEAAKKRIIEAMSQDGKIDSVVEIEKEYLDNGSIKITFVVNEGEQIVIQNLQYSNDLIFDTDLFDEVIANKEHEFMGWLWGRNDGEMSVSDLQYDPLRIRDTYMQYGYLDAQVNEPFVRVNFDNYTANMSYQITEGEIYTISKITINQVKKVIDDEAIRKVIHLEKGEAFNIKTFREDAQDIKTIISDLSYAFVQVVPDLKKNKKDHTVEVVFKIMPGYKVKIRNILIAGNNRTLDRIIRRELYLGPGDMYSLTDLKDSRSALGRLGFFDGNTIEEKRVDNKSMDLIVKVKEAPTGNVQIGGGYGSYGGLLVTLAVEDRNIWGSGINVGVKLDKSQVSSNYSFSISNPRLNDSDFSGNFSIYTSENEYNDYTVTSNGLNLGTGYRFTRYLSGFLGYSYSTNSYSNFSPTLVIDSLFFESYTKSSVTVSARFDNTDDFYLPREGMTASQSIEKAGVGGDADFVKSLTSFAKFNGLKRYIGFDAIFRYKARLKVVEDTGLMPLAEKFYMGGIGSVRGYQSYSLSPLDPSDTSRRIGGTKTFSNSIELSLPLIDKAKMRLVTYADWGFIGESSISEISRGGYGAGMEWFSPVGPIQLMFSKPLNQQEGDKTTSFEFTMGQRF